jgi:hypothetical protein
LMKMRRIIHIMDTHVNLLYIDLMAIMKHLKRKTSILI